jgi:hypothetical protein
VFIEANLTERAWAKGVHVMSEAHEFADAGAEIHAKA